jgi:hypothetical protein
MSDEEISYLCDLRATITRFIAGSTSISVVVGQDIYSPYTMGEKNYEVTPGRDGVEIRGEGTLVNRAFVPYLKIDGLKTSVKKKPVKPFHHSAPCNTAEQGGPCPLCPEGEEYSSNCGDPCKSEGDRRARLMARVERGLMANREGE